ncbi:MAG: hypothetical protein G01um101433_1006 [Parcubacteria group bacterium Gr01-1014_33]|nr:MAG: hypothetical protein G01um101433_1006 [Parcubacteria group bacterium Gr01-1014_33]
MAFLKDILQIEKEKMRIEAHIYPHQSLLNIKTYWQKVTGVQKEKVKVYVAVSRASRGKRPKNLLPHGTAYLKISGRQEFFKVLGFIDGLVKGIINETKLCQ